MREKRNHVRIEKPIVISLLSDSGTGRPQALADAVNFARSGKTVQLLVAWAAQNARRTIGQDVAWAKLVVESLSEREGEFSFLVNGPDRNIQVIVLTCGGETAVKTDPPVPLDPATLKEHLDRSVGTLAFTTRAINAFKLAKIRFIGDIVCYTDAELLSLNRIGKQTLEHVKEILAKL